MGSGALLPVFSALNFSILSLSSVSTLTLAECLDISTHGSYQVSHHP